MSLRNLEIFAEVCKHMNMSRAAEHLYISQSSVSQAIGELEKQYQVRLFERLSKKLFLTDAGGQLLSYARQILYLTEQMEARMHDISGAEQLRIGACTTVGFYFMNPLLDKYQELCPQVRTMVEVGNSSQLEKKILDAQLDLAFVQDITHAKEVTRESSLADRLILICRSDHPLADKEIDEEKLDGQPFVAREAGSGTRRLLEEIFAKKGIAPQYAWICNSIASMKDAVIHGRGICLLSEHLVKQELQEGSLAQIQLKNREFKRHFFLICHKNKYKTEGMERFIRLCRQQTETS
ncbi:LysR family transcriptional regulator [Anaerovorax odorimutans]|uniref:LysR family transcriptional regulator n=1 Tax=Anaerovorax odorimutans TaxID=109327 RepID=A0ABT1RPQ9_9FIRM|nr:LysR family transcriptional regulator [Anaerovorax odorimutans]MCQ4637167.1 LysR family transcriptional regulator [Anaerovorax odorimutans]